VASPAAAEDSDTDATAACKDGEDKDEEDGEGEGSDQESKEFVAKGAIIARCSFEARITHAGPVSNRAEAIGITFTWAPICATTKASAHGKSAVSIGIGGGVDEDQRVAGDVGGVDEHAGVMPCVIVLVVPSIKSYL